jgi:sugar phosphate isomerase/epimerase
MRLRDTVPKEKIFFFQISDGFRMEPPMESNAVDGTPPRGRWSHGFRPPPGQKGYLPVKKMVDAVLDTGFRGYFSMEVFLEQEHGKEWKQGLEEQWAKEGMESVKALLKQ